MDSLTLRISRETGNPRKPGVAVYRIYAEVPEGQHELSRLVRLLNALDPAKVPDHNAPEDDSMRPGDVHMPSAECTSRTTSR